MKFFIAFVGLLLGSFVGVKAARAQAYLTSRGFSILPVGANFEGALTPIPYSYFCARNPQYCTPRAGVYSVKGGAVDVTAAKRKGRDPLKEIVQVKEFMNSHYGQVADVNDVWNIMSIGGEGDCEDHAVTARMHLLNKGWPSASLLYAMGAQRDGRNHMVLVARTTQGDYVLDNLYNHVYKAPLLSNFNWKIVQNPWNPSVFFYVDDSR